jgi:hypothetical protein
MYISVFYEGKGVGGITDVNGVYKIETRRGWNKVTFSAIGYVTKVVTIPSGAKELNVKLSAADIQLKEVVIKPQKEKYSRKNNPAVDFMRKVIANKSALRIEENDYFKVDKYQKMKTSLNDITPEKLEKGVYKKFSFLAKQVEVSPRTNKMILPISIQETASQILYRKDPKTEKTIIKGMNASGVDELFSTGDMLSTVLKDVFSDVNIYDNNIRLLQTPFVSPISESAISFYKFYLMDTVMVDKHECVHLTFVPQNSQDFGFTGHLYVLKDSTYAVKRCLMNLPKKSGVNFVENLDIIQNYEQLSNGQWVLTDDDMIVDLALFKSMQGIQVERTTKYTNHSFDPIEARLFKLKGDVIKETDMLTKTDEFWATYRQVPLTKTENSMDLFVNQLQQIPGFKFIIFGAKALIENFVETGTKDNPSKFDFGPINTMVSSNYIDGTRLRLSGQTTGNLDPHWFLSGYAAYGFKDQKWKYKGELLYAFNKRKYLPWEYPKNNLSLSYSYDVMSPMDKFLATDKDNVFVAWKTTTVDQMSYVRDATLTYDLETAGGFSIKLMGRNRNDEPTGKLEYLLNDATLTDDQARIHDITTTELNATLRYAPGETFVNTKQRRFPVSLDAPVFTLSHTMGVKGIMGGEYNFHLTEASALSVQRLRHDRQNGRHQRDFGALLH